MKNNSFKYLLIVCALGVWTAIIFRVISGLGSTANKYSNKISITAPEIKSSTDSFKIFADYPDPFLKENDLDDTIINNKITHQKPAGPVKGVAAPPPKEIVESIIQFNGLITNPQKRSRVAIITLRGKEYLVKEKDKLGNIEIIRIGRTKLTITYKHELFSINN